MADQALRKEPDACAFRFNRIFAATMLTATLLIRVSAAYAGTMTAPPISVNGSHVTIRGLERNGSVFVPVRGVFEKLGATVTYTGSSLVATQHGKELAHMMVGSRSARINGSPKKLSVAPFISSGTVMLPLRVISEAAGASVAYASSPRSVTISRSTGGAMPAAVAAGAGTGAAATVARAPATDVASAAPATDAQTNQSGFPWWIWALLALIVLGLIFWAIVRRKKEPVITTRSSVRGSEPTITTRK